MTQIVWESKLDNKYRCIVIRLAAYKGNLQIATLSDNKLIHEQFVGISYDATFGPDEGDVYEWENICCNIVDNLSSDEISS